MMKNVRSRASRRTSPAGNGHVRIHLPGGNPVVGLHGSLTSLPIDTDPGSKLLTVAQAAQWLNISPSSVRRLQQRRLVPFVKIGGSVRFLKRDLEAYLARSRIEPIGQ